MKVIILAGGLGTRLSEYTDIIPKPMVELNKKPIVFHIMKTYIKYGLTDFVLALGYKKKYVIDYFLKHKNLVEIIGNDKKKSIVRFRIHNKICKIYLVDTGLKTNTGGRIKRLKNIINNEKFMITYGDGIANINIEKLLKFHNLKKGIATITAVHPVARFGMLEINSKNKVTYFKEKPQTKKDWINGGFFICEPEFINYIKGDSTILEKSPLEIISKRNKLFAYKHLGLWMCMDTKRDKDNIEKVLKKNLFFNE